MPVMTIRTATKSGIRCIYGVRVLLLSILLLGIVMIGAGCGGINASRSFSPLDFLLPGLLHIENSPQGQPLPQATNSVVVVAQR